MMLVVIWAYSEGMSGLSNLVTVQVIEGTY